MLEIFAGLTRLQKLYLDANQIEEIEENSFKYLTALRELNLQSNKLSGFVENSTFYNLKNLKVLNLNFNKLEYSKFKVENQKHVFLTQN